MRPIGKQGCFIPPPEYNPLAPTTKPEFPTELSQAILKDGKLKNLTFDPNFPNVEVEERLRPVLLYN